MNNNVDFCTKNKKYQEVFKNIHLQFIDIIAFKKHPSDHRSLLPEILYRTLYLGQQNITEKQCNDTEEDKWILPMKIDETNNGGIHVIHFSSLGKKLKLSSENYDQYYLQIHIGAIKCLQFQKQVNFFNNSIENICDLCFCHSEINLEALKHLTNCVSIMEKEQWKMSSKCIYKVLMGQMNHHLPPIHDQCILLFEKCLDLEDLDYILKIIMTEISWSLRIKFYMLTVIVSKYGVKMVSKYIFFKFIKYNMYFISCYNFRF